jgi:hypothetical protein
MKVSRQTLSAGLSGVALLAGSLAAQPASAQQYEPSVASPSSGRLSIAPQKTTEDESPVARAVAVPSGGSDYRGYSGRLSQPLDLPRPLRTEGRNVQTDSHNQDSVAVALTGDTTLRVRYANSTSVERPAVQRIAQAVVVPGGTVGPDTTTTTTEEPTTTAPPVAQQRPYRAGPSTSFYTPTGFGLSRGQAALWALYQADTRQSDNDDGSAGLVVGLGNPERLGFDVGVNFLSLFGGRGADAGFGERGSFNFKLHRRLRPDLAVAVGVRNTLIWNGSDAPTRYYAVGSKVFRLKEDIRAPFSRVYASLGIERSSVGSQQDPFEDEAESVIRKFGRTNVFGSLAVKLSQPVNAFAEWSGEDLNIGVSFVPFRRVPLIVTPALVDLTGEANDDPRFNLAVAYLFRF